MALQISQAVALIENETNRGSLFSGSKLDGGYGFFLKPGTIAQYMHADQLDPEAQPRFGCRAFT